jgi:predicted aspartyl protease
MSYPTISSGKSMRRYWLAAAALALALTLPAAGAIDSPAAAPAIDDELAEVIVVAPEPRYVAPTQRDRIGRVWVPVMINGQGPFRLVLDSGAMRSAVNMSVAQALRLRTDVSPPVMLLGVTGRAVTPTIVVDNISVGDLSVGPSVLPIIADAFGGAEGLLGMLGMENKRIYIDFRNDFINISLSRNRRAAAGFETIPFRKDPLNLLVVSARAGGLPVRAIIDTGAQASLGNEALRFALQRQINRKQQSKDEITGATGDMQTGVGVQITPIEIGEISIRDAHVTFGDMHIFERWDIGEEPALVIGMDILGLLDTLVIDYHRQELHIKLRRAS